MNIGNRLVENAQLDQSYSRNLYDVPLLCFLTSKLLTELEEPAARFAPCRCRFAHQKQNKPSQLVGFVVSSFCHLLKVFTFRLASSVNPLH